MMRSQVDSLSQVRDWIESDTEPTSTFPGLLWLDTSADPHELKRRNGADDGWINVGAASFDLSDNAPLTDAPAADPGTSPEVSRADHVHPLGPWPSFVMESDDGGLWTVTVDNTGSLTTTGFAALLTESGDLLLTESGQILALES